MLQFSSLIHCQLSGRQCISVLFLRACLLLIKPGGSEKTYILKNNEISTHIVSSYLSVKLCQVCTRRNTQSLCYPPAMFCRSSRRLWGAIQWASWKLRQILMGPNLSLLKEWHLPAWSAKSSYFIRWLSFCKNINEKALKSHRKNNKSTERDSTRSQPFGLM